MNQWPTESAPVFDDLPIGVFDSGVGGLTILNALAKRWPGEKFLYLADTARLPYGAKSPETIEHYLMQNIRYFLRAGVKAIIVACNSASTVLLAKKISFPLPVLNVIQPGAKTAAKKTQNNHIGIIGTRATTFSQAYVQALHAIEPKLQVFQQACPLLVPLIEENWVFDPLTNMVLFRYLQTLLKQNIDTLVMGCTHYPILREAIQKVTGPNIQLVEATEGLIEELEAKIKLSSDDVHGEIHVVCTDLTPHLKQLMNQLLSPNTAKSIQLIDLG